MLRPSPQPNNLRHPLHQAVEENPKEKNLLAMPRDAELFKCLAQLLCVGTLGLVLTKTIGFAHSRFQGMKLDAELCKCLSQALDVVRLGLVWTRTMVLAHGFSLDKRVLVSSKGSRRFMTSTSVARQQRTVILARRGHEDRANANNIGGHVLVVVVVLVAISTWLLPLTVYATVRVAGTAPHVWLVLVHGALGRAFAGKQGLAVPLGKLRVHFVSTIWVVWVGVWLRIISIMRVGQEICFREAHHELMMEEVRSVLCCLCGLLCQLQVS
ncbi:uncharacterized protein F5Z01DRAFT_203392 [Emericellopsis atlantica]|uniref:Uncharacterized protein n=1 Tax=Emericellopsis atlantica TaxID=2614577 RepID=A0A9P7ZVQ8_9HYPO|nr:uncharacterized protein F5Z01DRAFT_203392 [Emericellopsis atlantica]KAG9258590.1 hypothetical protein F5Z01DRAFT_203392 [Emericellopsis atlantica]